MDIKPPTLAANYAGRSLDCQEALEVELAKIIDKAQSVGWSQTESMEALDQLLKAFWVAFQEDPDPKDSPSELEDFSHDPDQEGSYAADQGGET